MELIHATLPVDPSPAFPNVPAVAEAAPEPAPIFELILRNSRRLTDVTLDAAKLPDITQQLVFISVAGMALHGFALGLASQLLLGANGPLTGHPAVYLPVAYPLALIGALCICLPSFYFYTQLAGLDASFRLITAQALRIMATTSVYTLAALPFFAALSLSPTLGLLARDSGIVELGLALPFFLGLLGLRDLYGALVQLTQQLPITHKRRGHIWFRLVLAWGAVYSVVAPLALYRLCGFFGHAL